VRAILGSGHRQPVAAANGGRLSQFLIRTDRPLSAKSWQDRIAKSRFHQALDHLGSSAHDDTRFESTSLKKRRLMPRMLLALGTRGRHIGKLPRLHVAMARSADGRDGRARAALPQTRHDRQIFLPAQAQINPRSNRRSSNPATIPSVEATATLKPAPAGILAQPAQWHPKRWIRVCPLAKQNGRESLAGSFSNSAGFAIFLVISLACSPHERHAV